MSDTAVLVASGPCLITALGAISMFLIGASLGTRVHALVWGAGFSCSALQWVLLALNIKTLGPAGPFFFANLLGIASTVLLAQGFRLRHRGRADGQAFFAAIVAAVVILLFVTFGPISPAARLATMPAVKLVFLVWAIPKVFASRYRVTPSEFAAVLMLVFAGTLNILIAVVSFAHATSGALGMIDAVLARAAIAAPLSAAVVLFSLLLIASDFSTVRRQLVQTDPLTRLLGRAGFDAAIRRAITRHRNLCIAFVDIDHFKAINDTYGHAIGDAVLAGFAVRLAAALRNDEVACRIGGEEFALILACDPATALRRVEALREGVAELVIGAIPDLRFTASFGIARVAHGESVSAIVERADRALYRSKREGRNRTTLTELTPA